MSTLNINDLHTTAGIRHTLARAWVNFVGTGIVTIRAANNVASIADNGVGDYTVTFTVPLKDDFYAVLMGSGNQTSVPTTATTRSFAVQSVSRSACRVFVGDNNTDAATDMAMISVVVLR